MDIDDDLSFFQDIENAEDFYALFNTSAEQYDDWSDEDYNNIHDQISVGVQRFLPPVQVVLSCVGNLLCFIVMYRLKDKMHQICSYLLIISIFDFFIVLWVSGSAWLVKIVNRDYIKAFMNNSDIGCKVLKYFSELVSHLSTWVTVTVVIENACVHLRPDSARHFQAQRVTDVMCFILVLGMAFNLHYFWTFGVVALEFDVDVGTVIKDKYCFFLRKTLEGTSHPTDGFIWIMLDNILADQVPFVAVVVSLVLIHLVKNKKIRVKECNRRSPLEKEIFDYSGFVELSSQTLIALAWALPITFLPVIVLTLLNNVESIVRKPLVRLVDSLATEWRLLFFSSKFYLYLVTSRRIRLECALLFSPVTSMACKLYAHLRAYAPCSSRRERIPRDDPQYPEQSEAFV